MPSRFSPSTARPDGGRSDFSPRRKFAALSKGMVRLGCLSLVFSPMAALHAQMALTDPSEPAEISTDSLAVDAVDNTGNDAQSLRASTADSGLGAAEVASETADIATEGAGEVATESLKNSEPEKGGLVFKGAVASIFDDNIFLLDSEKSDDIILMARLGVEFAPVESGDGSFYAAYGATGFKYLDHSDLDGVNHAARLRMALNLPSTQLGLAAFYARLSGSAEGLLGQFSGSGAQRASAAEREGVQYVERDLFSATATASHDLGSKTLLTSVLSYRGAFYESGFRNSQNFYGRLGLGYKATERTIVGVAGGYGYLDSDNNPTQKYQEALLTLRYEATEKLKLSADGGVEFRQYDGASSEGDAVNPSFNIEAEYQMRERTVLKLDAGRLVDTSTVSAQTSIERNYVDLGVDQFIGEKFLFSLNGGYESATYESTGVSGVNRDENYWYTRTALNYLPNSRTTLGVFYEHRDNDSDGENGRTYVGNQIGIQFALSF